MRVNREGLRQEVVVSVVYVAALAMNLLDTTIVYVALPTLARDFNTNSSSIEWVVTGYLLSLAVWIPASGWIGDKFGSRRTFLFALFLFTLGSALCGFAQSMIQLILFRVLQGMGGGMLTPVGFAMLYRTFPPEKRATVAKILMIPTACAPACGPIVGGLLVDSWSWRWAFWINLPIGILALAFGWFYLKEHKEERPGAFDLPGFILAGSSLALLLYFLSQGPVQGWTSPLLLTIGGLAGAGLILFIVIELQRREPILHLRLLKDRLFRTTLTLSIFSMGAFQGFLFLMPLYLQTARDESALESGLTTFPEAVGVLLASQISGRVYGYVGPRRLISGGLFATGALMLTLLFMDLSTSLWLIRLLILAMGIAMAFVLIPLQVSTLANIRSQDTGQASAIANTFRRVAVALGVAVLATVLTLSLPSTGTSSATSPHEMLKAFHYAFGVAAALAFTAALCALLIRDSDAQATLHPRAPKVDRHSPALSGASSEST